MAAIGVGVIGCGYWGPNLIRNFARHDDATMVSVCDMQLDRAKKVAGWYGIPSVTDDPSALINNPDVSLVVVATPAGSHYSLAKAALEAGKHVLIMKPMTTRSDQAEELIDLAERKGVLLAVDHTFVYTSGVRMMREIVAAGELGDVFYLDSVRINLGVFQSDVNVIWDLGPHDISIIDYVLGGQLPSEVSAITAAHAGSRHENIAYLTMRYGPSVLAHVHVNWLAPAKIRRTIVGGSNKMLVYDEMQPSEKLLIYDRGVTISPWEDPEEIYSQLVSYRTGDVRAPRLDEREALATEVDEILAAIGGGSPPIGDAALGLRTVQILEAAERSARDGSRPVVLGRDVAPGTAAFTIAGNGNLNGNGNGSGNGHAAFPARTTGE
jgi:predicted dehydrogenase